MNSLDEALRPLALWLINHALHSSLLLVLAWAIATRLRSAALRGLVWRVALVGGIFTASVGGFAGSEWSRLELGGNSAAESQTSTGGSPLALELGQASSEFSRDTTPAAAIPAGNAQDMAVSGTGLLASWPMIIVLLWLACAGFGVARWRRARRDLALHASQREPLNDERVRTRLDHVLLQSRWRGPVKLSVCAGLPSPIALGGNEICLPAEVTKLSDAALDALLAHECAHLARRDPRWNSIAHFVEGVFAYLPLHRVARRQLTVEAELASDAWAARTTGEPMQLARCLAEVADWMSDRQLPAMVSAMARRGSELVRRVEVLVDGTPVDPAPRQLQACTGAAFLALVAFACGAPTVGENGEGDEARRTIEARIESPRRAAPYASVQIDSGGIARVESKGTQPSGPFDLNAKEGLVALRAELSAVASAMPHEMHGDLDLPEGELRIMLEPGTRYHYAQKVMAECGAFKVQIWNITVAESPHEVYSVPLPVDLGVSTYLTAQTFELTVRVKRTDGERLVTYTGGIVPRGPIEEVEESVEDDFVATGSPVQPVADLDALAQRLKEARKADPEISLTIDARPGTVYADIVAILDITLEIGFEQVVFVGSYE
jgi:beta-lactamase regulating signal transducer with metallopeptidase domain